MRIQILLVWTSILACAAPQNEGEDAIPTTSPTSGGEERSSSTPPESPTSDTPTAGNRTAPAADNDSMTPPITNAEAADAPPADGDAPELPSEAERTAEPATTNFEDISNLLTSNGEKRRYGAAVTDIDQDGDFEVVITGYGGSNEVWDFRDNVFQDVAPSALQDPTRKAIGVAACDLNGDGREEVYFLNVDRFGGLGQVSDRLYRRNGETWTDIFEESQNVSAVNRFSGRSVLCFDRDGDGKYGVFVANYGGPMKLFEVNDEWRLTDVAPMLGMNLTTGGRSLVNLPGSNGQMQLFAGNENGPNFFFTGSNPDYQNAADAMGISDRTETVRGVAVLDADEDGLFDLVYGNWNGPHRLFLNRGDYFTDSAPPSMAEPSPIRTVIAADFDNDGYEEIFWNQIGAPNRLFRQQDGAWVEQDPGPALEPEGLGTGGAVLDIDGDGRLELFLAHGESGAQPLTAYRWGTNTNHFLRIKPLTQYGAPARGAVVIIDNGARTQRRVIDAGSGYLCQMEPVAHFGLGENGSTVDVRVLWPDGSEVTRESVAVDQRLDIPYPSSD